MQVVLLQLLSRHCGQEEREIGTGSGCGLAVLLFLYYIIEGGMCGNHL